MNTRILYLGFILFSTILSGQYNGQLPDDFHSYPDPLLSLNGELIQNTEDWKCRRTEILDLFRNNVYGNLPCEYDSLVPEFIKEQEIESDPKFLFRQLKIHVFKEKKSISFNTVMFVPVDKEKVPSFIFINHREIKSLDPDSMIYSEFWPAGDIVKNGFAAIMLVARDLAPDNAENYYQGVIGKLYPDEMNKKNGMKTISAWAWGASRIMDYLEEDNLFDKDKVAVIGHSRGGKTALWCGANDERFRLVISNNSGNTGAALSRRPAGEQVSDINKMFPHWFCENYKNYSFDVNSLPVDQHMLLSLVAPRALYVASASDDEWADPLGEFYSLNMAVPVYRLDIQGMQLLEMPKDYETISSGPIAYHIRKGNHGLYPSDWEKYMTFFKKQLKE